VRLIAALLLLLYSKAATPERTVLQWWQIGEFGACTATDVRELGMCGTLVVNSKPDWRK
jgi:hypothetical protein